MAGAGPGPGLTDHELWKMLRRVSLIVMNAPLLRYEACVGTLLTFRSFQFDRDICVHSGLTGI